MAQYRLSAGQRVGRGGAVKASAYLARDCYQDERTGERYDYRSFERSPVLEEADHLRKLGEYGKQSHQPVLHSGLYSPDKAPGWARGPENIEKAWNAAIRAEKWSNAQVAERFQGNLSHEFTKEQAIWAVQDLAREFTRQGRMVQVSIHGPEPGPGHDPRNTHFHLLVSTRGIDEKGFKATKAAEQQDRYLHRSQYIEGLRETWAKIENRHLARHGYEARVDHRSYERQGIDREPEIHLSPRDWQKEQRGQPTRDGDHNRAIRQRNAERQRQSLDQAVEVAHRPAPQSEKHGAAMQLGERPAISREERAQLEREAKADHVPSGWIKANVEDIARELSPEYCAASARMESLNKQLEGVQWNKQQLGWEYEAGRYRADERWGEMGWLRQGAHYLGIQDSEFSNWKGVEEQSARSWASAAIKEKALKDQLKSATAETWRAYDAIEPQAERVLAERQERAAAAQKTLRDLNASEQFIANRQTAYRDRGLDQIDAAETDRNSIGRAIVAKHRKAMAREEPAAGHSDARELARLTEDERADRDAYGRLLTAEAVGRQLSPVFDSVAGQRDALRHEATEAEKDRGACMWRLGQVDGYIEAQRGRMGWLARKLHDYGISRNEGLDGYERQHSELIDKLEGLATAGAERADTLHNLDRAYDEEWSKVQPAAEQELSKCQQRAASAQKRLAEHRKAEKALDRAADRIVERWEKEIAEKERSGNRLDREQAALMRRTDPHEVARALNINAELARRVERNIELGRDRDQGWER